MSSDERPQKVSPLPFPELKDPTEALATINEFARSIDEMASRIDRVLSSPYMPLTEPTRVVPPPIRLKEEHAKTILSGLDSTKSQAEDGLRLIRERKLGEAAKTLMENAEKLSGDCPLCSEMLRKAALETGLAGLSKNLGERDWEGKLREAESTLNRLLNALPKLRESVLRST